MASVTFAIPGAIVEEDEEDLERISQGLDVVSLTEDVYLISHTHGRNRRAERGIAREELQRAVKYGKQERSYPGRDGLDRWRFTYSGVVYITDHEKRHEITSWREDDNSSMQGPIKFGALAGFSTHVVLVVDHSGSMRRDDVPGYSSRTEAVYDTLRREFVQPQLDMMRSKKGYTLGEAVVSLISMSDTSHVLLERAPIDDALATNIDNLAKDSARSHGNYLPAMTTVEELLEPDIKRQVQVVLLFLSDGAPSDHQFIECEHGVEVWSKDESAGTIVTHRKQVVTRFHDCGFGASCRKQVKLKVEEQCCKTIRKLASAFSEERFTVSTVAFGRHNADYSMLERMAQAGGSRGSFQKLGLAIQQLTSMMSTLTTTLTTLRTASSGMPLTLRDSLSRESSTSLKETKLSTSTWDIYCEEGTRSQGTRGTLKKKLVWSKDLGDFEAAPLREGVVGVAIKSEFFAQGAERVAHRCHEVEVTHVDGVDDAFSVNGYSLVSKESMFEEELLNSKFHKRVARMHAQGQELADRFNERVAKLCPDDPSLYVSFVPCWIYEVTDVRYKTNVAWILAEPKLEGKYIKWNNNGGKIIDSTKCYVPEGLVSQIPQAFSHFTWSVTDRKKLFCDLQGVWNDEDGFTFTDPACHKTTSGGKRTDKGEQGMKAFFESHTCSELCKKLALHPPMN